MVCSVLAPLGDNLTVDWSSGVLAFLAVMSSQLKPYSLAFGSEQIDKEKKTMSESKDTKDQMTEAMTTVNFFIDKVGIYLGDQCVQLACLSKSIEATAHD